MEKVVVGIDRSLNLVSVRTKEMDVIVVFLGATGVKASSECSDLYLVLNKGIVVGGVDNVSEIVETW